MIAYLAWAVKAFMILLKTPAILDKIKWNTKPPSPQIKDEAARTAKTRHFPTLDLGGGGGGREGGGLGFPFILSKIVAPLTLSLHTDPPHLSTPAMQALNARNYLLTMTLRRAVVGPAILSESLKFLLLLV